MAKSANYSDALHRLVVALNETGIRYALTGAAAVGYYGIPRTSMDIDVVMRGNLSEAQIAATMGISKGAVKSHTARAMTALRSVLERDI